MRSKYIYLIYEEGHGPHTSYRQSVLLSVHTVKHEAHTWLSRSRWSSDTATLWRALDGLSGPPDGKVLTKIKWDPSLLNTKDGMGGHLDRCSSEVEDWPDWGKVL